MALFTSDLTVRYRRFRAHYEHTYPISFFMIGVCKFVGEIGLACFALVGLVTLILRVADGSGIGLSAGSMQDKIVENSDVGIETPVEGLAISRGQFARIEQQQMSNKIELLTESSTPGLSSAYPTLKAGSQPSEKGTLDLALVTTKSIEAFPAGQAASILDYEWILARPKQHFVIQIASSSNFAKLLEFTKEIADNDKISIYPFKVTASAKIMYGVSIGEYARLDQALDAVKKYPASLKRYSPWIRKVGAIQKEITSISGHAHMSSAATS